MESLRSYFHTLLAHGVNFVVIGNFGAYLHGVNVQTQDADMAYQRTKDNHNRLLAALEEMDADIRHGESTARLPTNVPNLLEQSTMWNLRTFTATSTCCTPARGRLRLPASERRCGWT